MKNSTKKLSIVVPVYNVADYLANCLDSVLRQDLDRTLYEVVVINDGSTDSSGEIAEQYRQNHPNIRVHHQKNQGLSAARNQGISLATGTYLYFLDSDDYIAANTLGYLLGQLEKHDLDLLGVQVLQTRRLDVFDCANSNIMETEALEVTDGISYIADHNYLNNAWWYFIRRDFLLQTGLLFPVGRYVEDANFTAQLLAKSQRIATTSLDFYRYFIRPNSIMRKKSREHLLKMIADYEKNVADFETQIRELRSCTHPRRDDCLRRLEARQRSFVFFLLVRSVKAKLSGQELRAILERLKALGVYPITKFLSQDYRKPQYRVLQFIFNRGPLLDLSRRLYALVR